MLKKVKDKLYYYLAEKNWGVRREYGPYVESHQEEHAKTPWKHWWMLLQLNWHYRILRRKDTLYYAKPDRSSKRRLPYLEGAESAISGRRKEIYFVKDLLKYDLVSFDIFDTLILRPFAKPADLFMIVGKRLGRSEFYRIRTDAEKRAREQAMISKGNREVTIYDIYDIIEERTGIPGKLGAQTEIEVELQYCFANPYMQRVYRLLQEHEKPIVITSDMYLPKEIMEQLLNKAGYTGYEQLYISCDYGCSKRTQSLYEYVKRDFPGKRIIHVGDNLTSDIQSAEKCGLATRHYKNVHEIGAPYRADGLSALVGSAYAGIVNTQLHNGTEVYSPYYEYGFLYGGLYVFGFCNWIQQKAKKERIDKILFLSRDGAIYQKVYRKYFGEVPDEYFLWSRIANMKYTLLKNKEDFLKRVVRYRANNVIKFSIGTLLDSFGLYAIKIYLPNYKLKSETLILPETVRAVERLFLDHWNEICQIFEPEKRALKDYIAQKIGSSEKVAIIDVGWIGSGPQGLKYLIEEEFDMECKVYCWQAAARSVTMTDIVPDLMDQTISPYLFSEIFNRNHFDLHKKTNSGLNNTLFELFTQDISPSYFGISENAEFTFDIAEVENFQMITEIHKGIIAFCDLFYMLFKNDKFVCNISGYDAYCPYRFIIRDLSFFRTYFSNFSYCRGIGSDHRTQRIETFGDYLKNT